MSIIIDTANRIAGIGNRELRDLLAYGLEEVHNWRCGLVDTKECDAVASAFADWEDGGRTNVGRVLQPVHTRISRYVQGPVRSRVGRLQEFDDKDWDAPPRWRLNRDFFAPPKVRLSWGLMARVVAQQTWYSADMFIADYVDEVVKRLVADSHGYPMFFAEKEEELGQDLVIACYKYSLEQLAELARGDDDDVLHDSDPDFPAALAEAMSLGMLWD